MTANHCTTQQGYSEQGTKDCGPMPHTGADAGLLAGAGVALLLVGLCLRAGFRQMVGR